MARKKTVVAEEVVEIPEVTEAPKKEAPKIATSEILRSKRFRTKYQRDFMTVLLTEPSYTIDEAEQVLENYFNGKVEN